MLFVNVKEKIQFATLLLSIQAPVETPADLPTREHANISKTWPAIELDPSNLG